MDITISIPYNLFIGSKSFGLDAYFWTKLSEDFRKTLLVRPRGLIDRSPSKGSVILPIHVSPNQQLKDLESILDTVRHEKLRETVKKQRWKLGRFFFIPLPTQQGDTSRLTELVYAEYIAKDIVSSKIKRFDIGYLTIRYDPSKNIVLLGEKRDKIYQWLLINDDGFRTALENIARSAGF